MSSKKFVQSTPLAPQQNEVATGYLERLGRSQQELSERIKLNLEILRYLPELEGVFAERGSFMNWTTSPNSEVFTLGFTESRAGNGVSKSHGGLLSATLGTLSVAAPEGGLEEDAFNLDLIEKSIRNTIGSIANLGAGACWWAGFNGSELEKE
jgi:hypothetical protein